MLSRANLPIPKKSNHPGRLALARRKADAIIATGADSVVVANAEWQFGAELRCRDSKIKHLHLADFVAMAAHSEKWAAKSPCVTEGGCSVKC